MRCRQPVQPRDKSAATQPICVQVKRAERMAKTQCASGDRRDRTRLGLSEPPPRPLDVADSVHFVLIGCVPASNRRTRRHAGARPHTVRGVADCAPDLVRSPTGSAPTAPTSPATSASARALASAALPAISTCKRAEPAQLAGDRLRLLGGFSASERLGDQRTSLCERAGTTDAIVGAAPDKVPLHSGRNDDRRRAQRRCRAPAGSGPSGTTCTGVRFS